jgi:hypothetical protein
VLVAGSAWGAASRFGSSVAAAVAFAANFSISRCRFLASASASARAARNAALAVRHFVRSASGLRFALNRWYAALFFSRSTRRRSSSSCNAQVSPRCTNSFNWAFRSVRLKPGRSKPGKASNWLVSVIKTFIVCNVLNPQSLEI